MSNTSTNVNDHQSIADELLDLAIKIHPQTTRIDELKEILSNATATAGEGLRFASSKGMVSTKRGSVRTLRGQKGTVNMEAWGRLTKAKQSELLRLGVIVLEDDYSQNRKPAVEIKPIIPKADNDNAKPEAEASDAA